MFSKLILAAAIAALASAQDYGSKPGKTTRYWDCCKPSCAWAGKAGVTAPVKTCDVKNQPLADAAAKSGCDGGDAYMCSDHSPWVIDEKLAYGFAAVNFATGEEASCCSCYELTFNSGPVIGQKMIVQATNTGGDVGGDQFDLAIPGGGVGLFNACTKQYNAPPSGWGKQYGGIDSGAQCNSFDAAIKPGCSFRFGWFKGADNPTMQYKKVACPAAIVAKSGCSRTDDTPVPGPQPSSNATTPSVVSSAVPSVIKAPYTNSSSSAPLRSYMSTRIPSSVVKSSAGPKPTFGAGNSTISQGFSTVTTPRSTPAGTSSYSVPTASMDSQQAEAQKQQQAADQKNKELDEKNKELEAKNGADAARQQAEAEKKNKDCADGKCDGVVN